MQIMHISKSLYICILLWYFENMGCQVKAMPLFFCMSQLMYKFVTLKLNYI